MRRFHRSPAWGRACAAAGILALLGLPGAGCGGPREELSREEIEAGRQLYLSTGCAACHGAEGRGDGPAAVSLAIPPRNFRDPAAFRQGGSLDAVSRTIAEGVPGSQGAMPSHPFLSAEERRQLAAYVLSLAREHAGLDSNKE